MPAPHSNPRSHMRHPGEVLIMEFPGPVAALMTRGMLLGIKRRVERQTGCDETLRFTRASTPTTPV